ncbi:MAG TPA: SBBP repeat-containing protein [Terriglobia bacterium]|nr:SBBP repeat-containing protein [Terriglobia bacterium]
MIGILGVPVESARAAAAPVDPRPASQTMPNVRYGSLPLCFEPNQGQTDPEVRFLAHGPKYTLFLTSDEVSLALPLATAKGQDSAIDSVLRIKLVGGKSNATLMGMDELPGKSNYFIGNDPQKWRTNIPNFAKVRYDAVYPGVDLVYYGNQGQLEYDLVLAPGSDPGVIAFDVEAAAPRDRRHDGALLRIAENGDLAIGTDAGEVTLRKPVIYQPEPAVGGRQTAGRTLIDGGYKITQGGRVTFKIGSYDRRRPLVIDPVLQYSTFLGGNGGDAAFGIAVDSAGEAYVTGVTASANFPVKSAYQTAAGGSGDAFVAKLNSTGTGLVYSTFLGGGGSDAGNAIAVDSSGSAYITGATTSSNFPVTANVFQTMNNGSGNSNAFVAKLDPSGAKLTYSSYLGGSGPDYGQGIAVDSAGDAFVTGSTESFDFPTAPAVPFQRGNADCTTVNQIETCTADAFVAEVDPTATELTYSTYLGGTSADVGQAIALDAQGNAYVAGYTYSTNFPTQSAFQGASGGGEDCFVAALNATGTNLVFSTYLGGSGQDAAFGLALDASGNIYLTGSTTSTNFPIGPNAFQILYGGGGDAFLTKLSARAVSLVYSTFIGGSDLDQGNAVAIDSSGNAVVVGFTNSTNFPLEDASQDILGIFGAENCSTTNTTCSDAFITRFNPSGQLPGSGGFYSTYLGGSGADAAQAVALDSSGVPYVAGSTGSSNFPAIVGALQGTYAGNASSTNAFITKMGSGDFPAVAFTPQSINFGNQTLNVVSNPQRVTLINPGSSPLGITSIAASGDFAETNNCGAVVPAGSATCTINITYTPTVIGPSTEQVAITDNAAGSPHVVTVTGNGVSAGGGVLTLLPRSLIFPSLPVGSTSPTQTAQVVNASNVAITITAITASGDFAETNTCGVAIGIPAAVLNPGTSCAISITFTPTASGSRSGAVTIIDNASGGSQAISLTGTGSSLFTLSSANRTSTILVGTTSTTFMVTATASSTFTSNITFSCSGGATCTFSPASITAGQSTTVTVSGLSATTASPLTVTVTGTGGGNTATVGLSVFLQDYTITATPTLESVAAGSNATFTATITPSNGFNSTVLMACGVTTPQINYATCLWTPLTVTINGTAAATSTLTLETTAQQTARVWPRGRFPLGPGLPGGRLWMLLAAMMALLGGTHFWSRGFRRVFPLRLRWALVASGLLLLMLTGMSCQQYGYNVINAPNITGTLNGVYTVTLTGTLAGNSSVVRSTTVNLTVGPG